MHIAWASKAKQNFMKLLASYPEDAERWHNLLIDNFVEEVQEIPEEIRECGEGVWVIGVSTVFEI